MPKFFGMEGSKNRIEGTEDVQGIEALSTGLDSRRVVACSIIGI